MCKLKVQLVCVDEGIQHRWILHLPTVWFGFFQLNGCWNPARLLSSSTPSTNTSSSKPIHMGSQTLEPLLQMLHHVLQGGGGDMVVTTLFGDQLHLQLQPIHLHPHLRQLLLQPRQVGRIAFHLRKLLIYNLSNSSWNSQLEEGI